MSDSSLNTDTSSPASADTAANQRSAREQRHPDADESIHADLSGLPAYMRAPVHPKEPSPSAAPGSDELQRGSLERTVEETTPPSGQDASFADEFPDEDGYSPFPEAPEPLVVTPAGTSPPPAIRRDTPSGASSYLFTVLALFPLLPLTLMLTLQTIFTLDARELWFSDEIRHAAAFRTLLEQGKWLILEMNGQIYPDKPPLYFLFLRGLYEFVRTDGPMLHFTAAAISALLYLWATLGLGAFVARVDKRANLAAGIILLSTGFIMGIMHYARMDLLFSAVILCSHIFLYRACISPTSNYAGMITAFILAGIATLIKGPLGLVFPLCSIVCFTLWRGTPQRLFRPDFLAGLLAGMLPAALWLGAIYWHTAGDVDFILDTLIKQQTIDRAVDAFHHKETWHYYLTRLPLMFLPWTLLLPFLPWKELSVKNIHAAVAASRRPEGDGIAFLWSMALSSLLLLSCLSGKILVYFLPALPALAILAARSVLCLEGKNALLFRKSMAILLLVCAVGVIAATLMLFDLLSPPTLRGLPQWKLPANGMFFVIPVILLIFSGLLWTGLRSNRPEGVLLAVALTAMSLSYPLASMVAPSFDAVLSPKAQALMMRAYAQKGYTPVSYKVLGGTYTYYAGQNILSLPSLPSRSEDTADTMAEAGTSTGVSGDTAVYAPQREKTVIGMPRSRLNEWKKRPDCFQEVHSQWIETKEHVLLACPAEEDIRPAVVPYAPAPDFPGALLRRLGLPFPTGIAPEERREEHDTTK
ncbi:MAG: dolichyl-phosphate-mannose--protein mannosyltransferase [Desulfovibrio sp.]|jgi:4-amino-4-deoxy-L-arabinose transferase-like glycosyltransferase|nr:dolichyl-phosphate-mannose--protein mannosyltransferase [Desulfovibrio sp.]